ncbi:MAG: helix-turn-helix domain-containing protein, partial [Bacteroidia bacterium]|nr:helix-turn-helix domain-containing protein [Bacteroidia bacterium]
KYYRDLKNSLDTAREEGREEGVELTKTIARLFKAGKSMAEIAAEVGKPESYVSDLLREIGLIE